MTMSSPYRCKNETRRTLVRNTTGADGKPVLNGIDFLEVATADQKTLRVRFIHPLPGQSNQVPPSPAPPLTPANIVIDGGVRITGVRVRTVAAADRIPLLYSDERKTPLTAKVEPKGNEIDFDLKRE